MVRLGGEGPICALWSDESGTANTPAQIRPESYLLRGEHLFFHTSQNAGQAKVSGREIRLGGVVPICVQYLRNIEVNISRQCLFESGPSHMEVSLYFLLASSKISRGKARLVGGEIRTRWCGTNLHSMQAWNAWQMMPVRIRPES
jgi:hypothetical protein